MNKEQQEYISKHVQARNCGKCGRQVITCVYYAGSLLVCEWCMKSFLRTPKDKREEWIKDRKTY